MIWHRRPTEIEPQVVMPTVPVMIVPILNRRDLLEKMLATVDIPVEKLIVIDNSADGITQGMEGEGRVIVRLHHNIGVAPAWNLGIRMSPLAPWWCFVNNDMLFARGDLARIVEAIGRSDLVWLPDMATFAITPDAIERVGWFSEEFVPAYFEDNDYAYRCRLAGVHIEVLSPHFVGIPASSTIRSDRRLARENNRTFPFNESHYIEKWGGPPERERFRTPFDSGGDFRTWRLSMERLRDLTWRPE